MRLRTLALTLLALWPGVSSGQMHPHPRLYPSDLLARVRVKKAANDADWQATLASANTYLTKSIATVTITDATNSNPVQFTTAEAIGWTAGQVAIAGGTGAWAGVNKATSKSGWTTTVTGTNTFTIPVDSTAFGPFTGQSLTAWLGLYGSQPTVKTGYFDYGYQGEEFYYAAHRLALVYWAKKQDGDGDTGTYLAKAKEMLNNYTRAGAAGISMPVAPGTSVGESGTCFAARFQGTGVELLYDFLYADLTPTERTNAAATVNLYALACESPYAYKATPWAISNFYVGEHHNNAWAGYVMYDEDPTNGQAHINWATNSWNTIFAPAMDYPGGLLSSNFMFESWQYGGGSQARMLAYLMTVANNGGAQPDQTLLKRLANGIVYDRRPDKVLTNEESVSSAGGSVAMMGQLEPLVLGHMLAGTPEGGYMQQMLQDWGPKPSWGSTKYLALDYERLMYLGANTAADYSVLPKNQFFGGRAALYSRSGWGTSDNWVLMDLGTQQNVDHGARTAGNIDVVRGSDRLLGNVHNEDNADYSTGTSDGSNTLWLYDDGSYYFISQSAGYKGGQPVWGKYTHPTYKLGADFTFGINNLTEAYDNSYVNGNQQTQANRTMLYYFRAVLDKMNGVTIAFDRAKFKGGTYSKHLRWHFLSNPTAVDSTTYRGVVGSSSVAVRTLLPATPTISKVQNGSSTTYRIEVSDPASTTDFKALTVITADSSAVTTPPDATIITTDANFVGVQVASATPLVALFANGATAGMAPNYVWTSNTYTSASLTSTHAGTGQYVVSGLKAGNYAVTRNGTPQLSGQVVGADGVLAFTGTAGAYSITYQAHPQLLTDPAHITAMRAKAAALDSSWTALKAKCDTLAAEPIFWPAPIGGGDSGPRGYAYGSTSPRIGTGYYGDGFWAAVRPLAACYQTTAVSDPRTAATYAAQLKRILDVLAQPPMVVTRQGDSLVRYGHSWDAGGIDLAAGATPGFYSSLDTSLVAGDIVTVSGARGCTNLNGTFKIASKVSNFFTLTNTDGTAAPTLNANCTLRTVDPNANLGFATRFWIPTLAMAYDWTYDQLTSNEKADALLTMNEWMIEEKRQGYAQNASEQNYFSGYFWGLIAAYVATDGDNASMTTWFTDEIAAKFTAPNMLRDYENRWFSGGGYGEGLAAYGYGATRSLMNATYAMKLFGIDWTQAPYNFGFVDSQLSYYMGFVTPTRLALDDNEYVYPAGVTTSTPGITEPLFLSLSNLAFYSAVAREFNSSLASKFQQFYADVYAAQYAAAGGYAEHSIQGGKMPGWTTSVYPLIPEETDAFLYYDASAPTADWTAQSRLYKGWGGNYGIARTDWTTSATTVSLLGGPSLGWSGNGKTQFNSGAITIQRGNDHLVEYGLGTSARSWDIVTSKALHDTFHNERSTYGNKKNSIFWAGPNTSETRNQGLLARTNPPGNSIAVTSWPSTIDRSEDQAAYSYMRASGLESNNSTSAIDASYHQNAWTREVVMLRPKLIVVHDRTAVKNATDDRAMFWTFGRNISSASAPTGQSRYDVAYGGVYRGAYTQVLPASASINVVDHANYHFLYRAEVRPPADHRSDNWLAVFDTATTAGAVNTATVLTATNADAVQFDDSNRSVVAFPNALLAPSGTTVQGAPPAPTLPITYAFAGAAKHYVVGMTPNTAYHVTVSNGTATIANATGSGDTTSTAAGVLAFDGTGSTGPTITTSSLPNSIVGAPYSTTLAAVGGTAPYAWSIASGSCAGLSLSSGGVLSGTPTAVGTCPLTIQVTDSANASATQAYSITVSSGAPVGSGTILRGTRLQGTVVR